MLSSLRFAPFRFLWISIVLAQVGYWFSTITFQWVVTEASNSNATWLGVLYFATFSPFLLFSLPAGVLADTLDRRRSLMVVTACTTLLALGSAALAVATSTPQIATTLVQAFLAGTFIALSAPLANSLTANTVPADQLPRAVPLQALGLNVARVGGPALGGGLILLAGPAGSFSAYAIASFASLVAVRRIHPTPRTALNHTTPRETLLQRMASGIRHARERPPALLALALVAATSLLGASYPAILPVLASELDPAATQQTFIILVSANGIGSFIGVINIARRTRPVQLQSAAIELLLLGALMPFVGLSTHLVLTIVLVAACGALSLSVFTAVNTLLQQLVDDAQRGRVMSLYFMCWGGLLPFGGLGLGALTGQLSVTAGLIIFGVLAALAGTWILHRSRKPSQPSNRLPNM